jgi:hypothetical protein
MEDCEVFDMRSLRAAEERIDRMFIALGRNIVAMSRLVRRRIARNRSVFCGTNAEQAGEGRDSRRLRHPSQKSVTTMNDNDGGSSSIKHI